MGREPDPPPTARKDESPVGLDALVEAVLRSAKYADLDPGFVRGVGARELAGGKNLREAVKAAKSRLHQVAGVFLDRRPAYGEWLESLLAASRSGEPDGIRKACRAILESHASSRERLGILDGFHAALFRDLDPPRRVLDLACGLHPLSVPWMPLARGASYHACDVYRGLAGFLAEALPLLGVHAVAEARDVLRSCPNVRVDAAFLLKTLPGLERVDRSAPLRILEAVRADFVFVSFPARSLGGRSKGMKANYREWFLELVSGKPWEIREFGFPGETVFRVAK